MPIRRGAYGTYAYGTIAWSGSSPAEVVVLFPITKTIALPADVRKITLTPDTRKVTLKPDARQITLPPHPNQPKD